MGAGYAGPHLCASTVVEMSRWSRRQRADSRILGRMRRALVVALAGLAFAASAQAKLLLGVNGDLPRLDDLVGQNSIVHEAFLGWGQGQTWGAPFPSLFEQFGPIPMIHLGTAAKPPSTKEAISPAQLAAGRGDGYLIALNAAIATWAKGIYVRPMAEMNNTGNLYAAFGKDGSLKPGHTPADYRRAFARIYLILHGGSAAPITAKLKRLGLPGIAHDLPVNPFPRLRVVWSPLAGGTPKIPANAPDAYYPGRSYVDVEGGDIFDEVLTDTAPWRELEAMYAAAVKRKKPFSVPEWGLFSIDDPTFMQHMCTFLASRYATEESGFTEGKAGSVFDIALKPKSLAVYRRCITPLGAPMPHWAAAAPARSSRPSLPFAATPLVLLLLLLWLSRGTVPGRVAAASRRRFWPVSAGPR
jgi:hypothetical protein